MPQYEYAAPTSSYAGTIARLLAQRGDPAAQAALRIAEAQARAAEQRGTAWAGAIQTIGQIPAQVQQQQQQQKTQALDTKAKTLAVSTAERAESARTVLSEVMSATPKLSEDGVSVWDVPAITRAMADKGFGPEAGAAAQHLDGINDAFRKTRAAQLAVVQRGAQAVAAAGNDPILASHFLDQVEANQIYPKDTIAQYREFIQADPANVGKLTAYLMGPQKMENAAAGSMARNPVTGEVVPGSAVPERAGTGDYTINGQRFNAKGYPLGPAVPPQTAPKSLQSKAVLIDGKPAEASYNPADGTWQVAGQPIEASRIKPVPPASITLQQMGAEAARNAPPVDANRPDPKTGNLVDPQTGMTPNAVYQAALVHALENKLPALGFGQTPRAMALRMGITNKAGAMAAAAGVDLPTLQAEYRANSTALNKILPIATQTAASAGTAMDNLQLAIDQSDQVARTGAKFVNRYAQWVQGSFTPAKGLSQFETYVYTAAREYAKVVSGSAASVSGLTDSASREAEKLLNTAQAPATFKAVAQAMQNDMNNVTANQTKQIANVSSTIANFFSAINGGRPGQGASPVVPTSVTEGTVRPITDPGYPPGAEQTFRGGQWIRTK
jgi:hypothetical protein